MLSSSPHFPRIKRIRHQNKFTSTMVDSTRGPWDPYKVLIDPVAEYMRLQKECLIPREYMHVFELRQRARSSAAYVRLIIRLLKEDRLHELHKSQR